MKLKFEHLCSNTKFNWLHRRGVHIYSKSAYAHFMSKKVWCWVEGWVGGSAGLRIAHSNKKLPQNPKTLNPLNKVALAFYEQNFMNAICSWFSIALGAGAPLASAPDLASALRRVFLMAGLWPGLAINEACDCPSPAI